MKKKLIYLAIMAFIAVIAFNACKKDNSDFGTATSNNAIVGLRGSDCYTGLKKECGVLKFDSMAHFQQVYNCLHAEFESYSIAFDSLHSGLSDSLYNELIDSLGWSEMDPLIDFETAASHSSYRRDLDAAVDTWLAGGMSGPNPWHAAMMPDPVLATLLSSSQAFIIGNDLYWYDDTGKLYIVAGADCNDFDELVRDPGAAVANNENISQWAPATVGVCKYENGVFNDVFYPHPSDNYSYGWFQYFSVQPYYTIVGGQVSSFKVKFLQGWKRWRTRQQIENHGIFFDGDCNFERLYQIGTGRRCQLLPVFEYNWNTIYYYQTLNPVSDFTVNGQFTHSQLP